MQDLVSLVLDLLFGGQSTHLYHRIISPWSPLLSDSSQRRKIDLISIKPDFPRWSAICHSSGSLPGGLVGSPWIQKTTASQAVCCTPTEAKAVSDIAPTTGFPDPQVPSQISHWIFFHSKSGGRKCGGASMFTALIHSKHRRVLPAAENPQRKTKQGQSQSLAGFYCAYWEIEKSHIHFCLNEVNDPPKVTHLPPRRFTHSKAPGFQFNMKRTDLTPNISLQFNPGASFTDSVLN